MQRTMSASPATRATSSGSLSGLNATPTWRPCCARGGDRRGDVVDDLVVERHAVAAGRRDLREVARRVVDHEVTVEHAARVVHARRDRAEDDRADRDGLDEVPVPDVEVKDATAGVEEDVDLLAEAREVGRVERRLDLDGLRPHRA